MSILIKGMEMPTSCRACPLATRFFDGEDVCAMLGTYVHDRDREDDCPLVPVPPHGRLIDADALPTYDKPIGKMMMFGGEYVYTQTAIDNAPTIIEAEPEVHDCDNCKWFGGLMCDHVDENYKCLGWEAEEVDNG